MRVTTGSAKGRKIQMVAGDGVRPITDRAKQALFSILGEWILDTRVLDLFAGTGGVGIEALSRGANSAHFVDLNRKSIQTVQTNLKTCGLTERATVEQADSFTFLHRYLGTPFHFIYVAPPQYQDLWRKALLLIDQRPQLLAEFGAVVVQIHPKEDAPVALTHLQEYDRRHYGSVTLLFYAAVKDLQAQENEDEASKADDSEDDDSEDE